MRSVLCGGPAWRLLSRNHIAARYKFAENARTRGMPMRPLLTSLAHCNATSRSAERESMRAQLSDSLHLF